MQCIAYIRAYVYYTCIFQYLHESIKDEFATIYKEAERMAAKLAVTSTIPRAATKQQHWDKLPLENPGEYYKREYYCNTYC